MLTKFILTINDREYQLKDDDLNNWDEITCSYVRRDYDGVVRSMSSQFEFVNDARYIVLEAFLKNGYNTQASMSVWTANDNWIYEKQFEFPLDFATIKWDAYTLKVNCLDNSLAAVIKANRSIKYELTVGTDVVADMPLNYDRISFCNSVNFYLTGETNGSSTLLKCEENRAHCVGFYIGAEEVYIPGATQYNDQQETSGDDISTRFFVANQVIDVDIEYGALISSTKNLPVFVKNMSVYCMHYNNAGAQKGLYTLGSINQYLGFRTKLPLSGQIGQYLVLVGDEHQIVWEWKKENGKEVWVNTNQTLSEFRKTAPTYRKSFQMQAGDYLSMHIQCVMVEEYRPGEYRYDRYCELHAQRFRISWYASSNPIDIDTVKPLDLCNAICSRLAKGNGFRIPVHISDFDSRIANTRILAAESIRGLANAKLYTSFNEFADWMQTVFGYTYYVGDPRPESNQFTAKIRISEVVEVPYMTGDDVFDEECKSEDVIFIALVSNAGRGPVCAAYCGDDGKLCTVWDGCDAYNDPVTRTARTDVLFVDDISCKAYYSNGNNVIEFDGDFSNIGGIVQDLYFVHRSELMRADSVARRIYGVTDIEYSVKSDMIYSAITIGYDAKDYDSINGRDEFNFNNTYSTGCTLVSKTLSLISKYRADGYGLEFVAQKRGEDTTDTSSDKDVFFVLCKTNGDSLVLDRTAKIENALSSAVFNGAFSPMACVMANSGYIGMQSDALNLRFTSSTGNSDVVINGQKMSDDISLGKPLATTGIVRFVTDDVDNIASPDELIEIVDGGGVTYRGYLQEVDIVYPRNEAAEYKLIVKEIEI